jgi:hypothetical protein
VDKVEQCRCNTRQKDGETEPLKADRVS